MINNVGDLYESAGKTREALERYASAAELLRHALSQDSRDPQHRSDYDVVLHNYARLQRQTGHTSEAVKIARQCKDLRPADARGLYNAACELALCAQVVENEKDKLGLINESVAVIRAAVAAGWNDAAQTCRDPDLTALKNNKQFSRLLEDMLDRAFPTNPLAPP